MTYACFRSGHRTHFMRRRSTPWRPNFMRRTAAALWHHTSEMFALWRNARRSDNERVGLQQSRIRKQSSNPPNPNPNPFSFYLYRIFFDRLPHVFFSKFTYLFGIPGISSTLNILPPTLPLLQICFLTTKNWPLLNIHLSKITKSMLFDLQLIFDIQSINLLASKTNIFYRKIDEIVGLKTSG